MTPPIPPTAPPEGKPTSPTAAPAIEVDDLAKAFGDTVAVEGISFRVDPGEIVGLIGPDGAGKTTTMRILTGLLRADLGRARVAGFSSDSDSREVKARVGYMPQRFSLYPDLSVGENLRFFGDLFDVTGSDRREQERRLLEFSRLGPFRNRRAGQLSGGMKQKLALSCTLIHRPAVLILDEPTTGVDPVSRREFWKILGDLAHDGLGLLVSTPYMDEASRCNRIILLHRGRVLTQGTPAEIRGRFRRKLVAVQGGRLQEVRASLLGIDGIEVHRFGDRLHVLHGTVEQRRRIEDVASRMAANVETIEPSLEDVFVELTASTGTGDRSDGGSGDRPGGSSGGNSNGSSDRRPGNRSDDRSGGGPGGEG